MSSTSNSTHEFWHVLKMLCIFAVTLCVILAIANNCRNSPAHECTVQNISYYNVPFDQDIHVSAKKLNNGGHFDELAM